MTVRIDRTKRQIEKWLGEKQMGELAHRLALSPLEVSALLGLSRDTVYQLLVSGEIPSIKIGGSYRISTDRLRELLRGAVAESV